MRIRRHNQRALDYQLNGFDLTGTSSDFIDIAKEKMFDNMDKMREEQKEAARKLAEDAG